MNSCSICGLPVMELNGQFEYLEPYYIESGHPAAELAGECHATCIAASEHGRAWYEWRLRNYTTVRGYRLAAEEAGWSVLVHTRLSELLAFRMDGISVDGNRRMKARGEKRVEGGILIPIDEEFNLTHDNAAIINDINTQLQAQGRYPIAAALTAFGIADRVMWPQALEGAAFVLNTQRHPHRPRNHLDMRARYARFLPDPVVPFWNRL